MLRIKLSLMTSTTYADRVANFASQRPTVVGSLGGSAGANAEGRRMNREASVAASPGPPTINEAGSTKRCMIEKCDAHFFVGTIHQHLNDWLIVDCSIRPKQSLTT
jgi:hypothetical protein